MVSALQRLAQSAWNEPLCLVIRPFALVYAVWSTVWVVPLRHCGCVWILFTSEAVIRSASMLERTIKTMEGEAVQLLSLLDAMHCPHERLF
jgi:hypothetical protein